MAQMKTPGVYLIEKDAFPNSVVEVATAVPAFIGYTEIAENGGKSLLNKPFRITSFSEYMRYFGGAPEYKFTLTSAAKMVADSPVDEKKAADAESAAEAADAKDPNKKALTDAAKAARAIVTAKTDAAAAKTAEDAAAAAPDDKDKAAAAKAARATADASATAAAKLNLDLNIHIQGTGYQLERDNSVPLYRLFDAMRFFFQNGGGPCYIVSVGVYGNGANPDIKKGLLDGTDADEPGFGLPTLEKEQEPTMVLVPDALSLDRASCYQVYEQVLAHCGKMMSRIGVFDVHNGWKDRKDPSEDDVVEGFRSGVGANFLNYGAGYYPWVNTGIIQGTDISFQNLTDDSLPVLSELILNELGISATPVDGELPKVANTRKYIQLLPTYTAAYVKTKNEDPKSDDNPKPDDMNKTLVMLSPAYNAILKEVQSKLNLMPPASAMAGIYTMVDNTRGVWKAPANVSLSAAISPAVNITFESQEDLNMPLTGKAVNAIRSFVGEGILVWGARTLDGNSQDWRYINVRRTMIMLEQSVKAAAKAYVFEPNDANTWTTVKSMIDNFLYQQWKKGALVGSKSTDAYAVMVGLGSTMTGDDILNGIMRITVLVAISRPAEFIEITFQQQMQKS